MTESTLLKKIRQAINLDGRARIVRNTVGFDSERKVHYGLGIGSADLVGLLRSGRVFTLEVKAPGGRVQPEQAAWLAAVRRWGGFAAIVRSVAEALAALDRAEAGACE